MSGANHQRGNVRFWTVVRGVLLVVVLGFVAVPMLVVVWTSVQPDTYPAFPPSGLSLRWWDSALTGEWLLPMALSAEVAFGSAVCALVLGAAAAYGLSRGTGRGRAAPFVRSGRRLV